MTLKFKKGGPVLPAVLAAIILAGTFSFLIEPAAFGKDAQEIWSELVKMARGTEEPKEWATRAPTPAERAKYDWANGEQAVQAADKAREFYTLFPNHQKTAETRTMELSLLQNALLLGYTNRQEALDKLEADYLKDPKLSLGDRYFLRTMQIKRQARMKGKQGEGLMAEEYEKGAAALQKEFPGHPEVAEFLLDAALMLEGEKAAALARQILQQNSPGWVRRNAEEILYHMGLVGKPISMKFKGDDGREVDLEKLRGKVILVDFWATWCPPCVAELPHLKATYRELNPKGFEIVGISLDEDKNDFRKFVKKEQIPWPIHFDAQGRDNQFAKEFRIGPIPTMWVLDKKGNLRYLRGSFDLKAKVEKLLAETI